MVVKAMVSQIVLARVVRIIISPERSNSLDAPARSQTTFNEFDMISPWLTKISLSPDNFLGVDIRFPLPRRLR